MPERLIYLSSGLHKGGRANLADIEYDTTYSDSKLQMVLLAKGIARRWPLVYSNAVDPGWVPTKMGGG
jgi:NAD(P)-dependent dehydrogenase (short-subunit alcohol dehydrogenase family)